MDAQLLVLPTNDASQLHSLREPAQTGGHPTRKIGIINKLGGLSPPKNIEIWGRGFRVLVFREKALKIQIQEKAEENMEERGGSHDYGIGKWGK